MEVTAIEIVEYSSQEVVESFDMRGKVDAGSGAD